MKKVFIFTLILFLLIISCEKDKSNPKQGNNVNLELGLEIIHGNEQTGVYNSLLKDSLVVKVTDNEGNPVAKAPVNFELKTGSGEVTPDWVITDSLGLAYVKWTIGCNSDYNELAAYLNDSLSNKIDSVIFTANASLPNGWGKSCGIEYTDQVKAVFREHNGIIYLVSYGKIYTTNDGGISWQEYKNMPSIPMNSYISDIQFNSNGRMYVATENNGIYYSEDYKTWQQINNGMSDYRYPMSFLVEDTCLFISFYFGGLYRTSDNGKFWKKLLINGRDDENYYHINRHPNGDLYLFDRSDNFWHSSSNGDIWDKINLDHKYINIGVEDFIIDKEGSLYIGSEDATLSILSSETYQGSMHSYYEGFGISKDIDDIKIIDNNAYYAVNWGTNPGIYSSKNWDKLDLGFENPIYTYYLKTDGTFLIASSDGVYYYNKQ